MVTIPVSDKKKTAKGGTRELFGFVTLTEETAKFLNYEVSSANNKAKITKRKGSSSRTVSKIDGSASKSGPVADSLVLGGDEGGRSGGKRVILYTNKETKSGSKNKKQISINVPTWMTNLDISDFIATAFKNAKYGYGAKEIQPFFRVGKGKRYPIITKAAAQSLANGGGVDVGSEIKNSSDDIYVDALVAD